MTMLSRMRRHKGWLKWSLLFVVVMFIILYIPNFLKGRGQISPDDVLASVDSRTVTAGQYQSAYQERVAQLKQAYAGQIDDKMLQQFGIGQQILQQMLAEATVLAEADRLGITVSQAELRERLVRLPAFQDERGQFVGEARYHQFLANQRPPRRWQDFEEQFRKALIAEKLQTAVTGWVKVSDEAVDAEYRKKNEKVKLELAVFTADHFKTGLTATDAELAAQLTAHEDLYRVAEKRRVKFLYIDPEMFRAAMNVTAQEIKTRYDASAATYSTPEQIRASHILLKTEGKDEATVKKAAEAVLAKVKAGGNFAALAKQYSEDENNKDKGGDLDFFGRGTMDKAFEDAAFALKPNEISDLVKTTYGFHIIKLVDKKAASSKTLADMTPQLTDQIKFEKAQAEASRVATEVAKDITTPADLDKVARAHGWTVGDSGLFLREEPLARIGFAPDVAAEAFTMEKDKVSKMLQAGQGFAFITLTEISPPYVPKLDDVKTKVRDDVIRQKAVDVAKTKAATMSKSAASGNFAAAAKAAGVDVKTTDFIGRQAALPEIGVTPAVDDIVFNLKTGAVTDPITTDSAVVVVHVKERQDVANDAVIAGRPAVRDEMLRNLQQEFFGAYMAKAKDKLKMKTHESAIRTVLGIGT